MPLECKFCSEEVALLHPDGQCHRCHTLERPEPVDRRATNDFPFEQSQSYDPIQSFFCLTCGATEFLVGKGGYRTVIKCKKCGWEACVHEG